MDENKDQSGDAPGPPSAPADAIVNPDTCRPQRIPPVQSRTRKLPVLDASSPSRVDFLAGDVPIAIPHDSEPLSPDRTGQARLIVPRLYAWRSAKWLESFELPEKQGFRKSGWYQMRGDPRNEERYGW